VAVLVRAGARIERIKLLFATDALTVQEHCPTIVKAMPKKVDPSGKTTQISLTLPAQVAEMLQELVVVGLYGASRSEVARSLILSRLEQLVGQNIVQLKRQPS